MPQESSPEYVQVERPLIEQLQALGRIWTSNAIDKHTRARP
jgi:hypothetical protein